jgi:hypothetical protein
MYDFSDPAVRLPISHLRIVSSKHYPSNHRNESEKWGSQIDESAISLVRQFS